MLWALGKPFSYNGRVFIVGAYNPTATDTRIAIWHSTDPAGVGWTRVANTGLTLPMTYYAGYGYFGGIDPALSNADYCSRDRRFIGVLARGGTDQSTFSMRIAKFDCSTLSWVGTWDYTNTTNYNSQIGNYKQGIGYYSGSNLCAGHQAPGTSGTDGIGFVFEGGSTMRVGAGWGIHTSMIWPNDNSGGQAWVWGEDTGNPGAFNAASTGGTLYLNQYSGSFGYGPCLPCPTVQGPGTWYAGVYGGRFGPVAVTFNGINSWASSRNVVGLPLGGFTFSNVTVHWDTNTNTLRFIGLRDNGGVYKWESTDNGVTYDGPTLIFNASGGTPGAIPLSDNANIVTFGTTTTTAAVIGNTYSDAVNNANALISGSSSAAGSGTFVFTAASAPPVNAQISGSSTASSSASLSNFIANNPTVASISGSSLASGSGSFTVIAQSIIAYIGLYYGSVTSGAKDGTVVSNINPIKSSNLYADGTDRISQSMKIAVRCINNGDQRSGSFTVQIVGSNAAKWSLAPDSGGSPGTFGNWGDPLVLTGPITDVNKIFWARARITSDESVIQLTNDTSVVLRIPNNVD